jgi:predicted SAM-dependent methyltransferase
MMEHLHSESMLDQKLVDKMFNLKQDNHPEKLWVLEQVGDADNVLDLGCGKHKTEERFKGVDIELVTDIQADISFLSMIESESVDCIVSRHSLEHLIDPVMALLEWQRVLVNGGKMIIVLPDHEKIDTMDLRLSAGKHLHAYTRDSFMDLIIILSNGSLRIEKAETVVEGWSFGIVIKVNK